MNNKFQNPLSRFLVAFLGLLGFLTACDSADLYGSPTASYFKLTGTVRDQKNNPISDAIVKVSAPRGSEWFAESTASNSDGSFYISSNYYWNSKLCVVTTCDGYTKDSTVIDMVYKDGFCEVSFNPVLSELPD